MYVARHTCTCSVRAPAKCTRLNSLSNLDAERDCLDFPWNFDPSASGWFWSVRCLHSSMHLYHQAFKQFVFAVSTGTDSPSSLCSTLATLIAKFQLIEEIMVRHSRHFSSLELPLRALGDTSPASTETRLSAPPLCKLTRPCRTPRYPPRFDPLKPDPFRFAVRRYSTSTWRSAFAHGWPRWLAASCVNRVIK